MPTAARRTAKAAEKPRPAHSRGRAEKSVAKREAILSAALDEFSAQGFAAARIDDVARRAGVSKATVSQLENGAGNPSPYHDYVDRLEFSRHCSLLVLLGIYSDRDYDDTTIRVISYCA